ncbi:MAG: TolC family protein [Chitinophagales bacterium]|nr:TolC family protein [Chitinophagales bacterium]
MYKFLLILLIPIGAFSQKALSIKNCIQIALEKNLQIKQSLIQESIARNNSKQSQNNLLPSVSVDMSGGLSLGNSLNPTTYEVQFRNAYSSTLGVGAQMTIFSGLQQINNIERSKALLSSASMDKETFINNLALTVSNLYLQILLAKELLTTSINQSKLTIEQIKRTAELIEAGVLPKGNSIDLEAQSARDELNIVKAQNNYDLLVFQMKQLLLMPLRADIQFETSYKLREALYNLDGIDTITSRALARMPQVKSDEFKLRAAQRQVYMSKGAFSPTLSLSYYSGSNFINLAQDVRDTTVIVDPSPIGNVFVPQLNSFVTINSLPSSYTGKIPDGERPYWMQISDNLSHRVTLSMSIPIFTKFQRKTNLSNSFLQLKNQELQLEQTKNKIREEIYTAYINYKNAQKAYYANVTNAKAFDNSLNFAREKFNAGVINSLDFNTTVTNDQNAKSELLRSKYEYIFRKIVLDFYVYGVVNIE